MKLTRNAFGAAFSSLALLSTQGYAAEITWEQPINLFQGTTTQDFVSTNGDPLVAYNATNLTGNGTTGVDATVNGVVFVGAEVGTTIVGTGGVTESITINSGGNNQGAFGDGQFASDGEILNLLAGGSFNITTVTLGGLTIGSTYEIQIISHDGRNSRANAVTAFGDGETDGVAASPPINLNNSNTGDAFAGGTGDFILGSFTADAETLTFDVFGDSDSTNGIVFGTGNSPSAINALQLRDISALAGDTDSDGLPDFYEIANGLDINVNDANIDSDMDGILNIDEFNNDPQLPAGNPDADNDGLSDGDEVDGLVNTFGTPVDTAEQLTTGVSLGAPTNPLDADSDDDGVNDFDEVNGTLNTSFANEATDPNLADTDDDLLQDDFELANGLNPNDDGSIDPANGGTGDPDGDSLNNSLELQNGTDPQDADTDDDGFPDGGPLDENGDPTGELVVNIQGDFPVVNEVFTDPLNPDSDGDKILDGEEVIVGLDGFITDPNAFDTDADGVPDAFEILEGVDPTLETGASASPAYADIDWSVEPTDDVLNAGTLLSTGVGVEGIRQDGTLVYAENYNGGDVTANGVPFTGVVNTDVPRCSDNVFTLFPASATLGSIYQGAATELGPLLDSVWFNLNPFRPHILLTGLTVGQDYFVQFGISEDRGGRDGRYAVVDDTFGGDTATDPIGETHTIFGTGATALIFTGTFTAALETQMFDLRAFDATGNTDEDQVFLPFLQVRIDDGSQPAPEEVVIVDCGFDTNGDYFIELATDATGAIVSESPDLETAFAAIDGASVATEGNIITIDAEAIDADADGSSFFQVSF